MERMGRDCVPNTRLFDLAAVDGYRGNGPKIVLNTDYPCHSLYRVLIRTEHEDQLG